MSCPAKRAHRVCTEAEDFGPCDECRHGEPYTPNCGYECANGFHDGDDPECWSPGPDFAGDYTASRLDAMAKAIRKLEGTVRHLSAALRAVSK